MSPSVSISISLCSQDMANDIVQVGTFVHHGDFWFAGFMVVFVSLSLLCTIFMVSEQSPLKRGDLVGEARLCLARQVPTKAWQGMLGAERNIEAPGTGLIGPYGAALLSLTPLQAASCALWALQFSKGHGRGEAGLRGREF